MSDVLSVLLGGELAGTLTRLSDGRIRFDYSGDYRGRAAPTPLSVSMPTQIESHRDGVIVPWLWGLLPDNEAVLSRWSRELHVSASSPFALLGTPIGHDCAGAVQFAAPEEVGELISRPGEVAWLSEEMVARRLRELREDSTSWLGREFSGQFSLAGAQAKTALLLENGRWGVPSGAAATSHILKPAVAGLDDHDLNEHLCLDAARRAGLIAARTRVERFGDETAIVVDRYDRHATGAGLRRIHQEDLCQSLGVRPSRKYQNEGGPTPEDVVRLIRSSTPPRVAETEVWRFLDALAWNWLIAGTDAHAKNYSLLLAGDQVRLAPLYDIASALPYGVHEKKLRLAMKIGNDYGVSPERNSWPRAAQQLGLDEQQVLARLAHLADRAPAAFAAAAAEPEVADLHRPLPERLVDLVEDRVSRCRALL